MKIDNIDNYVLLGTVSIGHEKAPYVVYIASLDIKAEGESIQEALYNARIAAGKLLAEKEDNGELLPPPFPDTIEKGNILLDVWMTPFREELNWKRVNKNVVLPKWLRDLGEDSGINFSQLLQSALKDVLGINYIDDPHKRNKG